MSVYEYIRIDDYSLTIEEVARRLGCSKISDAARACYRDRSSVPCRFYKDYVDSPDIWLCGGGKDYENNCKYKLSELLGELGNW